MPTVGAAATVTHTRRRKRKQSGRNTSSSSSSRLTKKQPRVLPSVLKTAEKEYYTSVAEKDFQQQFLEVGRAYGWLIFHDYDSRKNEPGFPDNVCVHPRGDFFVAELKTERGRLRPQQKVWLAAWCAAGIENHVWRPSNIDIIIDRFKNIRKV